MFINWPIFYTLHDLLISGNDSGIAAMSVCLLNKNMDACHDI